jgi:hypothetical protein
VKVATVDPPEPVAFAVKVCGPVLRFVSVAGLAQAVGLSLSSVQSTDAAFCAVQANVADVEVVDADGVDVKTIVGAEGEGRLGGGGEGAATDHDVEIDCV